MTTDRPIAAGTHNHPPRCCCWTYDPDTPDDGTTPYICPGCPEHGELAPTIDCPQCHTPIGRPHTEYCTLGPDQVWDGVLPDVPVKLHNGQIIIDFEALDQAKPGPQLVCRRCNGYGLIVTDPSTGTGTRCPDCTR